MAGDGVSCACGNARHAEPLTPDQCRECWDRINAPYLAALVRAPNLALSLPVAEPCVHLGESVGGFERQALGLDHVRDWRRCGLGLSVGGSPPGVVCGCRGCGPGCPGYAAADR